MRSKLSSLARVVVGAAVLALGAAYAQVTISYLTHWPPETVDLLSAAIDKYEAANPGVKIEVRAVPFGNLLSTLRSQATSPNGPTITGIYELWLPELVKSGIADAAPDAYSADVLANWPAGLVGSVSSDGTVYGYPNEVNLYALNYNKRLFAEAGIDGPPTTWEELIADAKKLTKRQGNTIVQQGFGLINSWPAGVVHPWLSFVYSNGGKFLDGTTATLDSPATEAVTELYHQLIFDDKVTDPAMGTANASTTGPYLQNFANGQTAMIVMANWWQSALRDSMGDAFDDIATAPIPVGPNGTDPHPVSYAWLTMVNSHATAEQRAAAWAFLEWLDGPTSGENGSSAMGDILSSMGIIPSRNSDVAAHSDELSSPFLQGYVSQLSNAIPFPTILGGEEISNALQQWLERVEFGQSSVADMTKNANKEIDEILERNY
ncbi:MAG: extracellular solute-binding protein [Trueperaceae bacterium]